MSHGINKVTAERNQRALVELAQKPGNDVCADCKARTPRWASHNLGIFICMNCASIHRKMGTHISKVKSITMDTWHKEQVEFMKQNGNLKSNAYYNPDEVRNPPPTNLTEQERDSELEKYIRGKYEFKRFINRAPAQPSPSQLPPVPQPKPVPARPSTAAASVPHPPRADSLGYRPSTTAGVKPSSQPFQTTRSVSQPSPQSQFQPQSLPPPRAPPSAPLKPSDNPVWDDLISLQGTSGVSSLPLQYQSNMQMLGSTGSVSLPSANPYAGAAPFAQTQMTSPTAMSAIGNGMGMGSTGMNPGMGMGGANPFQQANFNTTAFSPTSAAPNPFTQSYLPTGAANPFAGMGAQQQSAPFRSQIQPFSQTPAAQQFQASLQSQSQPQTFFQPQPQPPAQQVQQPFGQQPSPFAQQPSPYGQQQSSPFGQQPSPFGHQPSPQLQPPQPTFTPGNPFGGWQQQPGTYGGQQWGGM